MNNSLTNIYIIFLTKSVKHINNHGQISHINLYMVVGVYD